MRFACRIASLVLLAAFPFGARAQVTISEIAWMGTDAGGANCEWVELRNTTDEIIDLSSWTLTIENAGTGAPKVIALGEAASVKYSGIAANGYYLLARDSGSCKDLVPATSADWLGSFGNGISNSGAKLILKQGADEKDGVDSKAGWETSKAGIGGKNTAPKETPQRNGASWITAAPTPRGPNQSAPLEELPEEEEATTTPVVTIGGTAPLVPVTHPIPELFVEGGPARIVVAGADTIFSGIAYDSVGTLRKNADITWSFGDGGHRKGEEVTHAYRKPGDYTAIVRARDKGVSAVAIVPVTVVESGVSIEAVTEEGIVLTNAGSKMADLTAWKFSNGSRMVRLPPDTVIAAGGSVFFPYETLSLQPGADVALAYPNGKIAHAFVQPSEEDAELQPVQEAVPARALAANPARTYAYGDPAPAAEAILSAAGAPVATSTVEEPTVMLAKKQGIFSSVRSLLSSVFLYASDSFSY